MKPVTDSSLYDRLLLELDLDFNEFDTQSFYSRTYESPMVYYMDSRTGCEASMSTGRWYALMGFRAGIAKRYIGPTAGPSVSLALREQLAVSEFMSDNARCEEFNAGYRPDSLPLFVKEVRKQVRKSLRNSLSDGPGYSVISASNLAQGMKSGPGSSSRVQGPTGFYSRLCNNILTFSTRHAQSIYNRLSMSSPVSYLAELERRNKFGLFDKLGVPAVFCSVPKTNSKNRGICTQPSGNMALQLATHAVLTYVLLKSYGCDLSTQQFKNRKLAQLGSKVTYHGRNRTWKFCTFDLSSASNFPWILIVDLFPYAVVEWLDAIRSHFMEVNLGGDLRIKVKKHMCSTMGNGFTFSLMTVLLSAIVQSLYRLADLPEYDVDPITGQSFKTWAVYGDDIIVDKSVGNALRQVLSAWGFKINSDKSFEDGYFRESCGADYYDGYPVRPVFLETLETQADVYSLLNRINEWGFTHSFYFHRTAAFLRRTVKDLGEELRVPNWVDVSAGIRVPFSMSYPPTRKRVPSFVKKAAGVDRFCDGRFFELLRPKQPFRAIFTRVWYESNYGEVFVGPPLEKVAGSNIVWSEGANKAGTLLSMLGGFVRDGKFSFALTGQVELQTVWAYTPSWGDPDFLWGTNSSFYGGSRHTVYLSWERYIQNTFNGVRVAPSL